MTAFYCFNPFNCRSLLQTIFTTNNISFKGILTNFKIFVIPFYYVIKGFVTVVHGARVLYNRELN